VWRLRLRLLPGVLGALVVLWQRLQSSAILQAVGARMLQRLLWRAPRLPSRILPRCILLLMVMTVVGLRLVVPAGLLCLHLRHLRHLPLPAAHCADLLCLLVVAEVCLLQLLLEVRGCLLLLLWLPLLLLLLLHIEPWPARLPPAKPRHHRLLLLLLQLTAAASGAPDVTAGRRDALQQRQHGIICKQAGHARAGSRGCKETCGSRPSARKLRARRLQCTRTCCGAAGRLAATARAVLRLLLLWGSRMLWCALRGPRCVLACRRLIWLWLWLWLHGQRCRLGLWLRCCADAVAVPPEDARPLGWQNLEARCCCGGGGGCGGCCYCCWRWRCLRAPVLDATSRSPRDGRGAAAVGCRIAAAHGQHLCCAAWRVALHEQALEACQVLGAGWISR
jgi:hypothetical protein